jgi:hypothetical protein
LSDRYGLLDCAGGYGQFFDEGRNLFAERHSVLPRAIIMVVLRVPRAVALSSIVMLVVTGLRVVMTKLVEVTVALLVT